MITSATKTKLTCFTTKFLKSIGLNFTGRCWCCAACLVHRTMIKEFLPEDEFQFWLVTTTASSDSVILMDHLTDNLRGFLKSPLTREMMNVVDIIPSTELAEKLSAQAIEID